MHYDLLVDYDTRIVLSCVPAHTRPALIEVAKHTTEIFPVFGMASPNYSENRFMATLPPDEHPEWTWIVGKRKFKRTATELLSLSVRSQARLLTQKIFLLDFLFQHLSYKRMEAIPGIAYQEMISTRKIHESERLLANDTPPEEQNFPYLRQVAEMEKITLSDAAHEEVLRSGMLEAALLSTERIRHVYTEKIIGARTEEELREVRRQLSVDISVDALI